MISVTSKWRSLGESATRVRIGPFDTRLLGGIGGQGLETDGSAQFRFQKETVYLYPQISNSSVLGHGFGYAYNPIDTGRFFSGKSVNHALLCAQFLLVDVSQDRTDRSVCRALGDVESNLLGVRESCVTISRPRCCRGWAPCLLLRGSDATRGTHVCSTGSPARHVRYIQRKQWGRLSGIDGIAVHVSHYSK